MGDPIDLMGHALIEPRLNLAEYDYLTAFAQSPRNHAPDRYAVPVNPGAPARSGSYGGSDQSDEVGTGNDRIRHQGRRRVRRPGRSEQRQPSTWCPWVPTAGGRVLAPHLPGQGNAAVAWLRYLIRNFLTHERSTRDPDPRFCSFTFDHVLDGVFVARWRRSGRMCVIRVRANRVRQQVLTVGDPDAEYWGSLPCEDELDRVRLTRSARRRIGTATDLVYQAAEAAR